MDDLLASLTVDNARPMLRRPVTISLPLLNALLGTRHESRHPLWDLDARALRRTPALRRVFMGALTALCRVWRDPAARSAGLCVRFGCDAQDFCVTALPLWDGSWSLTLDFASTASPGEAKK